MILDHTNPDSVTRAIASTTQTLMALRSNAKEWGLDIDVRLVSNADGECSFATGDVSFDTTHGAACEATTVSGSDDDDTLTKAATHLVEGVRDQLAELADDQS